MGTLWQDIKFGIRMLARSPGFTAVVLLVIGVSVGANTALFNALDQVYMRPLPVKKPHELVSVQCRWRHGAWESVNGTWSYPTYEMYRDKPELFAELAAFTSSDSMDLRSGDEVTRVYGMAVSNNYFSGLGLRPALGRLLHSADDAAKPVAVISHRLWHRRFGGQAEAIGKQILLDNRPLTLVGIAPAGFTGTIVGRGTDIYLPLTTYATPEALHDPNPNLVHLLGRPKPGVTDDQAQAVLQALSTQMNPPRSGEPEITPLVMDGSQGYVPRDAQMASYPLGLFLGIAVLVLVIACANIANLQLARATTRQKEIAIRQALGAGRRRIIRQLLVESLLLALVAGACGVVLAVGLDRGVCIFLPQLVSPHMPSDAQIHLTPGLHPRILLFALAVSLATGLAFGLTPALQLVRRDVIPALKESTSAIALPRHRWSPHNLLVVGQIAVAVVVTVCSGLCLRNLIELKRTNPGFAPERIVAVTLSDGIWPTHDQPQYRQFMESLHEQFCRLPSVESICLASNAPLSESGNMTQIDRVEGFDRPPGRTLHFFYNVVSPEYFKTVGQTLLAGRDFSADDGPDAPSVTIVDETFAKRYWPGQNPIGKHVTLTGTLGRETAERTVVGVVKAVKLRSILEESRPWAYFPLAQYPKFTPVILARTEGDPESLIPTIRKEAATIQPAPTCDIRTVADRVWGLLLPQRILTGILNSFALVGLFLSATGIYAVMAYAVRQRTREIGIRIALGAQDRHVLLPVLLRGTSLLALGLGLGLGLSWAGVQLLTSQLSTIQKWDKFFLSGIDTWNAWTYVSAALVIAAVTLTACYLPARRAAKIDPMVALRYE